jgi:RNA polymerase sigma-70 factor (ECF subfamily)
MKKRAKPVGMNALNNLIEACRRNDRRAQVELYDLFSRTMFNTSYRLVKNLAEAEDITQEAFLAAYRNIGSFRNEVPFDGWLRRIVINRSLDYLRKQKHVFTELNEDIPDSAGNADYNGEYDENREALRRQLIAGLAMLPEGFRIILSLYYFEGYDHEEIAHILKISPSTSRSQLTRAKRKLGTLLNQHHKTQ